MYKLELAEIFTCQLDSEAYTFLPQYRSMVEWWIARGKKSDASFRELRNCFYRDWKTDWKGYNSQHAQTTSLVAHNIHKFSETQTIEKVQGSFIVVSPRIAKIEDGQLVFPTKQPKKAHVQLVPKNSTQKSLLEQTQNKYWQIGQIFLTPKWCTIPLTRLLDLTKEEKDPQIQSLIK
jgi:hypothetical protein